MSLTYNLQNRYFCNNFSVHGKTWVFVKMVIITQINKILIRYCIYAILFIEMVCFHFVHNDTLWDQLICFFLRSAPFGTNSAM